MKNIARNFKNFIINPMSDVSISSPEDLYMPESERPAYFSTVPASSVPQGDQPWKAREEFRPIDPLPNKHFENEKAWGKDGLQQKQLLKKEKALLPEEALLNADREHKDDDYRASPEEFFADDEFEEETPQTHFPLLPFPEQQVEQQEPIQDLPYKSNRKMLLPPALHLPFSQSGGRLLAADELGFEINQKPRPVMPVKMRSNGVYAQLKEAMEKINIRFGIQPEDLKSLNQFSGQGVRTLDPKLCDQLNQSLDIMTSEGIFNNRKTAQGAKMARILQALGCTLLDNGEFDIESIKKAVLMALLLPSSQRYPNDYAACLMQNLLHNNPVQIADWLVQLIQYGSVRVHGNFGFPLGDDMAFERLDNVLVDLCGLSLSVYLGNKTEAFSLNPTQIFSKLGYTVICRQVPFVEYLQQDKGVNPSTIDKALAFCVIQGLNHYLKVLRERNDAQKVSLLQQYSPDAFLMCFAIGRGQAHVFNVKVHPYLQELFREKIKNHDFSNFFPSEVLSLLQTRNSSENLCGTCGPVLFDVLCRVVNLKDIIAAIVYPDVEDMVSLGFAKERVPDKAVVENVLPDDVHDSLKQQAAMQENEVEIVSMRAKLADMNQKLKDIAVKIKSGWDLVQWVSDKVQKVVDAWGKDSSASTQERMFKVISVFAGPSEDDSGQTKNKAGDESEQSADKEQTTKNADTEKFPTAETKKNEEENSQQSVTKEQKSENVNSSDAQSPNEAKGAKRPKKNKNINKENKKNVPAEAPRKRGRPKKIR